MRICFLGTGTPEPDPERCGSGTALLPAGSSAWFLVDCGRGITQRVAQAGLDLRDLAAVLLTHHHSDHVSDLPTLAIARFVAGAEGPLRVVVPEGPSRRYAERCLDAFEDSAFHSQRRAGVAERPSLVVEPFTAAEVVTDVLEAAGTTFAAALVDHGPMEAAVGYRATSGASVVAISGDTVAGPGVRALSTGADVLVHQALRSDRVDADALTWNASARSVGELAEDLGVAHLVLTHLMPRPRHADDERAFVAEARAGGWSGPITLARDLEVLDVG